MSSPQAKKIVRKVFYATGSALGKADKIKDDLVQILKSFQVGYLLLGNESSVEKTEPLQKKIREVNTEPLTSSQNPVLVKPATSENVHEDPPHAGYSADEKIRSEDALTRLKGVVNLSKEGTPQSRKVLLSYSKDPDSLIRRVIINCISTDGGQEEVFAIVKFINDPDEDVARVAIRKSAKTRNRLAFTYLISRLDSDNVKIRKEAIDALVIITGSDLGFDPTASISQRTESSKLWQQIWQNNQMNPLFLIDEDATRAVIKKKNIKKTNDIQEN